MEDFITSLLALLLEPLACASHPYINDVIISSEEVAVTPHLS